MIIVDKAEKTTINIPKNNLGGMEYGERATQKWVIENFYTKEEIDEIVAKLKIPYICVQQTSANTFEYTDGSDYDSVFDALQNNQPYLIYVPTEENHYSIAQEVYIDYGINANVFLYGTYGSYLYHYEMGKYGISRWKREINFAEQNDIEQFGVYSFIVGKSKYTDMFIVTNYVSWDNMIDAINSNIKQCAIYVPSFDNSYKLLTTDIKLVDNNILCKSIEIVDNALLMSNWLFRYELDEYDNEYIVVENTNATTINLATTEWVEQQGYLTEIPDEYVTENELKIEIDKIDFSLPTIIIDYANGSYTGDMDSVVNAYTNDKPFNVYVKNGDIIYYSTQLVVGGDSVTAYFFRVANDKLQRIGYIYNLYDYSYRGKNSNNVNVPIDNLTSYSSTSSLSANQGRVLNSKFINYFTKTESNNKFQIKGDYITNGALEDKLNELNLATTEWVEQQGFLTAIPSEYVTDNELNDALENIDYSFPTAFINFVNGSVDGDLAGVVDAYKNNEQFNLFVDDGDTHRYKVTQITNNDTTISFFIFRMGNGKMERRGWVYDLPDLTYKQRVSTTASVPVDNLSSTDVGLPLSANQGRVLNERITNEIGNINTILENIIG